MIFETERLIIRNYRDVDRPIFAAIVGNPHARVYHRSVVTRAESDEFIDEQIETLCKSGFGYAVVEHKADCAVVGEVGIRPIPDYLPFSKDVRFDIGWQLDLQYFGQGYASEAAMGWLRHTSPKRQQGDVIAYTAANNTPSVNVMKRIGMIRDPSKDFDHPKVAEGSPPRPHIVYCI
jgi:RimJ/RimL family protein N-acetyltransferase